MSEANVNEEDLLALEESMNSWVRKLNRYAEDLDLLAKAVKDCVASNVAEDGICEIEDANADSILFLG